MGGTNARGPCLLQLTADNLKPGTNEKGTLSFGNGLKEGGNKETQYLGVLSSLGARDLELDSDSPRVVPDVLCRQNCRKMVSDVGVISSTFDRKRNDFCLIGTILLGPIDLHSKRNVIVGFGSNNDSPPPYDR